MRFFLLLLVTISAFANDRFQVISFDKFGTRQKYFTGYVPNPEARKKVQIRDFPLAKGAYAFDPIPDEYYVPEQRIFKQLCGDCWAQGGASAFEAVVSLYDKVSIFISRQQVIDCSGDGSCGGGDISLNDYVKPKGAVYEADYPYQGQTGRCNKQAPLHEHAESEFQITDMTVSTLQRAMMETGPLEICGASSSLGNGGWVERNSEGGTDHCYSFNGWYQGDKHGHKKGVYFIVVNSWGKNWGDNGKGYYLMARDGEHFDGSVITEAAGLIYKPACTPQPIANAGPDQSLLLTRN